MIKISGLRVLKSNIVNLQDSDAFQSSVAKIDAKNVEKGIAGYSLRMLEELLIGSIRINKSFSPEELKDQITKIFKFRENIGLETSTKDREYVDYCYGMYLNKLL